MTGQPGGCGGSVAVELRAAPCGGEGAKVIIFINTRQ